MLQFVKRVSANEIFLRTFCRQIVLKDCRPRQHKSDYVFQLNCLLTNFRTEVFNEKRLEVAGIEPGTLRPKPDLANKDR